MPSNRFCVDDDRPVSFDLNWFLSNDTGSYNPSQDLNVNINTPSGREHKRKLIWGFCKFCVLTFGGRSRHLISTSYQVFCS